MTEKKVTKTSSKTKQISRKTAKKSNSKVDMEKGLLLPHYDSQGRKADPVVLPKSIVDRQVNLKLLTQSVRVYQANLRQGTLSTKTRGEVIGSTRKIYRQKGTGRARHGSIKAPIFVGGGIVFGPKPRDFSLKLPKKMRRKALAEILTQKAQTGELSIVSGLQDVSGKTKDMHKLVKTIGLIGKRVLFVLDPKMNKTVRAVRNLENVTVRTVPNVSTYEFIQNHYVVLAKEAFDSLKDVLMQKERQAV